MTDKPCPRFHEAETARFPRHVTRRPDAESKITARDFPHGALNFKCTSKKLLSFKIAILSYGSHPAKIKGLMFLLTIALRVFTLMEFVVRRQLHQSQSSLAGLYDGNPQRKTERPTAEKMLKAFSNITLYIHRDGSWEISSLNLVQQQILKLMLVPELIYTTGYLASG